MPQSIHIIYMHFVFATKFRRHLIDLSAEPVLHAILRDEYGKKNCIVVEINGMPDHVHMLVKCPPTVSISEIMQQVKGGSAFRCNRDQLIKPKLIWQDGYFVCSVSERDVKGIADYIRNQKQHHSKSSIVSSQEWI